MDWVSRKVVPGNLNPLGTVVFGTTGPINFVHSGLCRVSRAQPRASSKVSRLRVQALELSI